MPLTIAQALSKAASTLPEKNDSQADARVLLSHSLGKPKEFLFTYPEHKLSESEESLFHNLLERRVAGEPIAYLTGVREFWDIELKVNEHVLIPRPETELLVESALELVSQQVEAKVADLGTGSGAIALALAKARPHWQITAVDLSAHALLIAEQNAAQLHLHNVEFQLASWCAGLNKNTYNLIIANPPYVEEGDKHLQQGDLRFEPVLALTALQRGYGDLFTIAEQARACLQHGGWLLLEHGFEQHEQLKEKLLELGYCKIEGRQDLAGHMRMMQAQWLG